MNMKINRLAYRSALAIGLSRFRFARELFGNVPVQSVVRTDWYRPLEVNLNFPQSYNKTLEQVVDRMNNGMPTEKDLLNLHCRTKRLLNLIENILIQHEKLTLEAIRTLRTIRLVTKWTASFIFISLLYFYVRKFHSQSPIYQFISERRNVVAFILAGVGVTVYCYTHKELFLRTVAAIS